MTHYKNMEEWIKEGEKRFGQDQMEWKFVCPVCRYVAATKDWLAIGAEEDEVAFSCVGRHMKNKRKAFGGKEGPGPCDYAGGGFYNMNPVKIGGEENNYFDFAPRGDE